jgi:cell division initiation protein
MTYESSSYGRSPQEIRNVHFSQRLRGYDESEVHAFCEAVANQMQRQHDEQSRLRAEIARLKDLVENEDVKERAVALFSQAQTVADQLIEEAVEHAKDLMLAARAQQREILGQAGEAAKSVTATPRASGGPVVEPGTELAFVQTYVQVAAVQLRSVLDALSEQVDKLSQFPDASTLTIAPQDAAPQDAHDVRASTGSSDEVEPLIWASMMPKQTVRDPGW